MRNALLLGVAILLSSCVVAPYGRPYHGYGYGHGYGHYQGDYHGDGNGYYYPYRRHGQGDWDDD